jgi:hypothetical protein
MLICGVGRWQNLVLPVPLAIVCEPVVHLLEAEFGALAQAVLLCEQ